MYVKFILYRFFLFTQLQLFSKLKYIFSNLYRYYKITKEKMDKVNNLKKKKVFILNFIILFL